GRDLAVARRALAALRRRPRWPGVVAAAPRRREPARAPAPPGRRSLRREERDRSERPRRGRGLPEDRRPLDRAAAGRRPLVSASAKLAARARRRATGRHQDHARLARASAPRAGALAERPCLNYP